MKDSSFKASADVTGNVIEKTQSEASKNKMFAREVLAFLGAEDIESAREMSCHLERFEFLDGESSENSGGFTEQRCQFCHQPIKYPVRIETSANLGIIGNDCARKLIQFQETGKIISVTQTMREENRVFKDAFKGLIMTDENNILSREEKTRRKNILFSSMLTWSKQRVKSDPDSVPQNIQRAVNEIDLFGAPLGPNGAQNFLEWYVETRTLNPEDVLTAKEETLLETHPHKGMLQKALEGKPQRSIQDSQRVLRIINHYKDPLDLSQEIIRKLTGAGVVVINSQARHPQIEEGIINRKKTIIYNMLTHIFQGRFPEKYSLQDPEFVSSPAKRGREYHADIYAYEKTSEDRLLIDALPPISSSWAKESQFGAQISQEWLGRRIYTAELHRCYTVVMTEYGRIKIMEGERVVSQDIIEYLKAQGVEIVVRKKNEGSADESSRGMEEDKSTTKDE